jgi:TPR repeat protein
MYFFGRGQEKNYQQAMAWYTKAGDQNFADALLRLGYMNEKGFGTDINDRAAADYYQRAVRNGSVEAQRALDRLSAKMNSAAPPAANAGPPATGQAPANASPTQ